MEFKLNSDEQYIVNTQCNQCRWWHPEQGCEHNDATTPQPIDDCALYEEE